MTGALTHGGSTLKADGREDGDDDDVADDDDDDDGL